MRLSPYRLNPSPVFDGSLRPIKDRLLDPIARALGPKLHPNVVSVLSFLFGLAAAVLVFHQLYFAALLVWALSRLADGLDGSLARVHNRQTDFGGYLDILLDLVVYAAIPIALVLGSAASTSSYISLIALLAAYYVNVASWTYLAAIQEQRGRGARERKEETTVTMPPGLIEGTETTVFYVLFLILPTYAPKLFLAMTGLLIITISQRVTWAWRHLHVDNPRQGNS